MKLIQIRNAVEAAIAQQCRDGGYHSWRREPAYDIEVYYCTVCLAQIALGPS